MTPGPDVRPVQVSDLERIAELHLGAFPESVLGRLGTEAVRRSYLWQMEGPHDLTALAATTGGEVSGFLFGGVFRGSTIGFVKRERWFLARRVIANPRVVIQNAGRDRLRLAVGLLARRWSEPSAEQPAAVPRKSFGVLAIAVDPQFQGQGVGQALMREATDQARAAGFERMHLSVHPSNSGAVAFYRSLGWVPTPEPDGTWAGRMHRTLQSD